MVRRAYQPSQGEKPKEDYDLVEKKFLLHKTKIAKVSSHSFSLVNNFFEKEDLYNFLKMLVVNLYSCFFDKDKN